ncbi:uncharacterized protein LAJ45_02912 [Morchella importuna]|uniref:uncharacterized protein n=1 Tax=Morchella importuna TaxID=1174673 RepID=UPI001E8E4284|nr:uncharacterized protein LAJ45_02912 [Morchella importuna]KAH8153325.1 hypothetical protein LAJ45_02912 [Morchella importuna]
MTSTICTQGTGKHPDPQPPRREALPLSVVCNRSLTFQLFDHQTPQEERWTAPSLPSLDLRFAAGRV